MSNIVEVNLERQEITMLKPITEEKEKNNMGEMKKEKIKKNNGKHIYI